MGINAATYNKSYHHYIHEIIECFQHMKSHLRISSKATTWIISLVRQKHINRTYWTQGKTNSEWKRGRILQRKNVNKTFSIFFFPSFICSHEVPFISPCCGTFIQLFFNSGIEFHNFYFPLSLFLLFRQAYPRFIFIFERKIKPEFMYISTRSRAAGLPEITCTSACQWVECS